LGCSVKVSDVGSFGVYLSGNGVEYTNEIGRISSKFLFTFVSSSPAAAAWSGGTLVHVFGYGFDLSSNYVVRLVSKSSIFERRVVSEVVNATCIRFISPIWQPDSSNSNGLAAIGNGFDLVDLIIELDINRNVRSVILPFKFHGLYIIKSPSLNYMSPSGKAVVFFSVSEGDIYSDLSYEMQFSLFAIDAIVSASVNFIDEKSFAVEIPAISDYFSANSPVAYEYAEDSFYRVSARLVVSDSYTSPEVFFHYLPKVQLSEVFPKSVVETGGTVSIFGKNIPKLLGISKILCKFDVSSISPALGIFEDHIDCSIPAHAVGEVPLALSPNNGVDWISVEANITVFTKPQGLRINPNMGPKEGFTAVTLFGVEIGSLSSEGSIPFCRFGLVEVPTRNVSKDSVTCIAPPRLPLGDHIFSLVFRHRFGKAKEMLDFSFSYFVYEDVRVQSVFPKDIMATGGAMLTIIGTNFIDSPLTTVRFRINDTVFTDVLPTKVSPSEIKIVAPMNPIGFTSSVAEILVSNNGEDFSSDVLIIYYKESLAINTLYPTKLFEQGDTLVTLEGHGFYQTFPNALRCRFGGVHIVQGLYMSKTMIKCMAPSMSVGYIAIEVSNNGLDYFNAGTVEYVIFPIISAVYPVMGSYRGGTLISINLDRDWKAASSSLECHFGSAKTRAWQAAPKLLQCNSPAYHKNITTVVALSVHVADESSIIIRGVNSSFTYLRDSHFKSISQYFGPSNVVTSVDLFGNFENFLGTLQCRFGSFESSGLFISDTQIRCYTPESYPIGNRSTFIEKLFVSLNGIDFFDTGFGFEFYSPPVITLVTPLKCPVQGGIEINVYGSNFHIYDKSICSFGNELVQSTYVTSSHVRCVCPPSNLLEKMTFLYSENGINFEDPRVDFEYFKGPGIFKVEPSFGTFRGGSLVNVLGTNFYDDSERHWYCVFNHTAVKAQFFSKDVLRCITPYEHDYLAKTVPLFIALVNTSIERFDYYEELSSRVVVATGILDFSYVFPILINKVYPQQVMQSGGQVVNITASNIISKNINDLWCVWNSDDLFQEKLYVLAKIPGSDFDNGFIQCVAPEMERNESSLKVSLTLAYGKTVESDSFKTVEFLPEPTLLEVSPTRAIYGYNTTLLLRGNTFVKNEMLQEQPTCQFFMGSEMVGSSILSIANEHYARCAFPYTLPVQREVHRIRVVGEKSISEVQVLEISNLANDQNEVQRLKISSWGVTNPVVEIKAVARPTSTTALPHYELISQLSVNSEIQRIRIGPKAYSQELQVLSHRGVFSFLDDQIRDREASLRKNLLVTEDTGVMTLNVGLWNLTIFWNASETEMRSAFLQHIPIIRDVRVKKTVSFNGDADLINDYKNVNINWTFTFGVSDGNIPKIKVVNYNIPRAKSFTTQTFEVNDGYACEVQEIVLNDVYAQTPHGFIMDAGSYTLKLKNYVTGPVYVDTSPDDFKKLIIKSFLNVEDVVVNKVVLSAGSYKWIISFIDNPGSLPLISVATSNFVGASAYISTSKVVSGQAIPLNTGTFRLSGGNIASPPSSVTIDVKLPSSLNLITGVTSYIQNPNAADLMFDYNIIYSSSIGTVGMFTIVPLSVSSPAFSIKYTEVSDGTALSALTKITGWMKIITTSEITGQAISVSVPSGASFADLQTAFLSLGLGEVTGSRAVQGVGFIWRCTFLELVSSSPAITVDFSDLSAKGTMTNSWTKRYTSIGACCLNNPTFKLRNSLLMSSDLNVLSSAEDVAAAFVQIGLISSTGNAYVKSYTRPAGGVSWTVTLTLDDSRNTLSSLSLVPGSTAIALNGISAQALLSLNVRTTPMVAQIQRVQMTGAMLKGHFTLSLSTPTGLLTTRPMSINITAQRLEDEITRRLNIESVRITPIDLNPNPGPSVTQSSNSIHWPGDFRVWDIEFISIAGNAPILGCNTVNVDSQWTGSVTCTSTQIQSATSTNTGGTFKLGYNGKTSNNIAFNADANELKTAIQNTFAVSVNVTRNYLEPGPDYEWLITFLLNRDDEAMFTVDSTNLVGTDVSAWFSEVQRGSLLGGSFKLTFGGESTALLDYNADAYDVEKELEALYYIYDVTVTKQPLSIGYRYLITFISPAGDVSMIEPDCSAISGNSSTCRTYEYYKGVSNVHGSFHIQATNKEVSSRLTTESSAEDVRNALTTLSSVGDVVVSRTSFQHSNLVVTRTVDWLITFTTFGSPSNAGINSLFEIVDTLPQDGATFYFVDRIQSACCDIKINYNGINGNNAIASIGLVVDPVPTIVRVWPTTGFTSGGVNVSIYGENFHLTDDFKPNCLFGSKITAAVIVNSTYGYCTSPVHPKGIVVVAIDFYNIDNSHISVTRSISTFVYEPELVITSIWPYHSQIDQVTTVRVKLTDIGSDRDDLLCRWNITLVNPIGKVLGPIVTLSSVVRHNNTDLSCKTPIIYDTFINSANSEWFLNSNASALLSVSKNYQSSSNEFPMFFFSRPDVHAISPKVGVSTGGTRVTVSGSNFINTPYSACKIGNYSVPADIVSSSTAICYTPTISFQPPVHQFSILGPLINNEIQTIQLWIDNKEKSRMQGQVWFMLEGYRSTAVFLSPYSTTNDVKVALESIARVGTVTVSKQTSTSIEYLNGFTYQVTTFKVTFSSRQDDVPQMTIDMDDIRDWDLGHKLITTTELNGGSDTSVAERFVLNFTQGTRNSEIQRISVVSAVTVLATQEVQISNSQTGTLSGFFKLVYPPTGESSAAMPVDISDVNMAQALSVMTSVGDIFVTRSAVVDISNNLLGYKWTITFLDAIGPRQTFGLNTNAINGIVAPTFTVTPVATGTLVFRGTFFISAVKTTHGFGGTSQNIPYDSNSSLVEYYLEKAFGFDVNVSSPSSSSSFNRVWDVTFPASYGNIPVLSIDKSNIQGNSVVASVISTGATGVQDGSALLGNFLSSTVWIFWSFHERTDGRQHCHPPKSNQDLL